MDGRQDTRLRQNAIKVADRKRLGQEERIWKEYRGMFATILRKMEGLEAHNSEDRNKVWDKLRVLDNLFTQLEDPQLPAGTRSQRVEDINGLLREVDYILEDYRKNAKKGLREDRIYEGMNRRLGRMNKKAK